MRKLLNEELDRLSADEFKEHPKTPLIIVLDNVRSHLNVGSIFRTADSFLVEGLYLCGITGTPPHRDIHKTALGATETVNWTHYATALEAIINLKYKGFEIISIEQAKNALMLDDFQPEAGKKYALVFGNEVDGVDQQAVDESDAVVEIPQYGTKHSLNIAVSVGIVVWDIVSKSAIKRVTTKTQ